MQPPPPHLQSHLSLEPQQDLQSHLSREPPPPQPQGYIGVNDAPPQFMQPQYHHGGGGGEGASFSLLPPPFLEQQLAPYTQTELKAYLEQVRVANAANMRCADCDGPRTVFASGSLGVFLCLRCSTLHRSLPCHVTYVRNLMTDHWEAKHVARMQEVGNAAGETLYLAQVPLDRVRPTVKSPLRELERWIRDKYEYECFMRPEFRRDLT
jgi:hypothetical protein